jgi:hypothetical protein
MTKFETFLIDKGYTMYAFNAKENKLYKPKTHVISTMVNLGHIYIHNSNKIVFGLHEKGKPTTLISPRPRIEIKRLIDDKVVIFDEWYDDSMNVVLSKINFEDIFKAMYNKEIILKIEL